MKIKREDNSTDFLRTFRTTSGEFGEFSFIFIFGATPRICEIAKYGPEKRRMYIYIYISLSCDRIPVGARFFAPVQTSPGAYPASCTMGTDYFPGVKRPGRGADHPPPS